MLLSGGIFTLAVTLLAAQGPRPGGAKSKAGSRAPAAATTKTVTKTVNRSAASTSVRPHVVPAPRRADTGDTTQSRAPSPPQEQAADRTAGSAGAAPDSAGGDGAVATPTTKSAKTKVYTFGAMDVEGKLKTPQLLYFLNRVKLELEMSAPDHRSFMKELERTAEDSNL